MTRYAAAVARTKGCFTSTLAQSLELQSASSVHARTVGARSRCTATARPRCSPSKAPPPSYRSATSPPSWHPSRSGKSTRRECSAGLDTLTGGKAFTGVDLDVLDDNRLTILVPAGHPVDILPDISNPRPSMAY